MECNVKLASSCVVASVMLDLSSGHDQEWKAVLRKSISVKGSFSVPENNVRDENLLFFISMCIVVS